MPCDTYILFFLYLSARHCTLGVICQHTDNVGVGDIDEFNRNNFNLGKFKLKMRLVSIDIWTFGKIQESSIIQCWSQSKERIPKSCKKNYHCIQLSTKLIWYMKGCKTPLNAWKTLYNVHQTRSLSTIFLFVTSVWGTRCKKINYWTTCRSTPLCGGTHNNEDLVLTLLDSLPPLSYKHLITALKMMLMKDLIIKFMTSCLIHEMSKKWNTWLPIRWHTYDIIIACNVQLDDDIVMLVVGIGFIVVGALMRGKIKIILTIFSMCLSCSQ